MTFENQIWLIITPVIVLLVAGLFAYGLRRREALLGRFAAQRLLNQLTEKASQQRTLLKAALIILAFALIGIALARPQYGVDWIERKARGLDIVFVLDCSKSMLATDLRPTRLDRAKLAIIDLVKRLESDRIGLVAFAGNAFLQTPPTLDYSAFRESLESINYSTITRGGSDLGRAIQEATKAFPKDNNFKVVILLTDGEDQQQQAIETARQAAKDGIKIYSIGIGTPEGEYLKIRTPQGGDEFIRDAQGQPVRSQLDESTLQEIAKITGGSYSRLSDQSLNTLYNSVLATLPREERESELQEARIERYQWALAVACLFLVLEILIRRRGKVSVNIAIIVATTYLLTPTPNFAQALKIDPDLVTETEETLPLEIEPELIDHDVISDARLIYNQAHEQLTNGQFAEANRLYEQAIELSDDLQLERDALYNMAHATNQIGEAALQSQDFQAAIDEWKQAEALFKSASEIDSDDNLSREDAQTIEARRTALEEFLKQQEQQEQEDNQEQQENDEQQEEQESGEQDQQDQQSGDQDQQDQESGDQEQQDQQSGDQDDQEGQQSDESEDSDESEGEDSDEAGEQNESTRDPAEDMEQDAEEQEQAANQGEDDDEEESGEEQNQQAPQPSEGTAGEDGEPSEGEIQNIEGMSISEAQDLLDSLRHSERLLPFSEPSDETRKSNRTGHIRDW